MTLDALRGIAALIVVTRHASDYFRYGMFPETFLAVDLFFVLSGFVVADAYEGRLAAGGFFADFLKIRLIRLYPLYLVGLLLAVAFRVGSVRHGENGWTAHKLIVDGLLGFLMMGAALNGPMWTLLPELGSNAVFGAGLRWVNQRVLAIVAAAGLAGIVIAEAIGPLDSGFDLATAWIAIARVAFSFAVGVGLRHLTLARERRFSNWAALACCAFLAAALLAPVPLHWRAPYELALVALGFPVLVWIAVHVEPAGKPALIGSWLGAISYAVYTLHQPVDRLSKRWIDHFAHTRIEPGLMTGLGFIVAIAAIATVANQGDQWMRRRLMNRLIMRPRPAASEPGSALVRS